jgi:drug/metabolite transporter (DMT)-like permease
MSSGHGDVQSSHRFDEHPLNIPVPEFAGMLLGFTLLGVTALFFGAAPTFAKLAFNGGIDTLSLQIFRFTITFAAVLLMALVDRHLPRTARQHLPRLLILAICTAVSSFYYMTVVRHVSVAVASLTFFTFPLMVELMAHFLKIDRLGWRNSLAITVSFAGLYLVLGRDLELN